MASNKSSFSRYYDRIIALIAVLLLGASFYLWFAQNTGKDAERENFRNKVGALSPKNPAIDTTKSGKELAGYSNAYVRIGRPFKMASENLGGAGFFVPATRIWCAQNSCQAPIPPDSEDCPRCGTHQPTKQDLDKDATLDSDGDGMPDAWERQYNLNPLDPADAELDSDGDGFTNLEEFKAKTDPLDKNSHTDTMELLCVRSIEATKLPILFLATQLMPDKSYKCQFNYFDKETKQRVTLMLKEGDKFGPLPQLPGAGLSAPKRYADFLLKKIDWREEMVYSKFLKKERLEKIPVAIVERVSSGKTMEFRKEVEVTDTDYIITLVNSHNGDEYVAEGSEGIAEVTIEKKKFLVKKVDKSQNFVVIVNTTDKKELKIPSENGGLSTSGQVE